MSAFALAFSALLRVGEFACTSSNESEKIIQNNHINFDNDNTLSLRLRYTKTDQYGKSWTVIGSRMSDVPYNLFIPFNICFTIKC
jgi:hypothetical protein